MVRPVLSFQIRVFHTNVVDSISGLENGAYCIELLMISVYLAATERVIQASFVAGKEKWVFLRSSSCKVKLVF